MEIKDAKEVVEIADDPAMAFKLKPDSSLTVGLNLLKSGAGMPLSPPAPLGRCSPAPR